MLLDAGAPKVGLLDSSEERLQAACQSLGYPEDRCLPLNADVRDARQVKGAVDQFVEWSGSLNAVVHAAAVLLDGAIASVSFQGIRQYPIEHWDATLDTNLKGAFLVNRETLPRMMSKKGGVVIHISSVSRAGRAGQSAYSASKGGIVSLAASLAQELAPYGIRSVAIAPGLVDTPMAEQIPEVHRKDMLSRVAAGRMGRPEEIAHATRFCIENDFFNGRVLEVDGGAF